jgi:mxaJ protein
MRSTEPTRAALRAVNLLWPVLLLACTLAHARELRVCADPNNLPYSNAAGEGFENRIVAVLARDLGASVRYTWWAQRRGAVRNTLNAGTCDLVPGTATEAEITGTTIPYYRSTYVVVTRADRGLGALSSFDDPRLHHLRIGVQLIGDDGANTPPAQALAQRGIVDNVRGFMVYGDYSDRAPQSPIIDAVASGAIDAAFVWGPTAGYFAARASAPLRVQPVRDRIGAPMAFDISMGVRRRDQDMKREIDAALVRERTSIEAILAAYDVPTLPIAAPAAR